MNLLKLSLKNLLSKPLSTLLSVLLLVLSVALISLMLQVNKQLGETMENNINGIDMVVGAKGSPMQLVLSSVLHADVPTGNIKLWETKELETNHFVRQLIPLSYGDNYKGYRILGTIHDYVELYKGTIQNGSLWEEAFEVTLGAAVAENLQLKIGDTFEGSHGLVAEAIETHHHDFKVVGILAPTNSVLDQLILTNKESVWEVHEEEGKEVANADKEITALLVTFRNPMGMVQLPRMVNQNTSMQAAIPRYEVERLNKLMGFGTKTMLYVAILIMLISGVSIFISLYKAISERKYELALMRNYGASRAQLLWTAILEGLIVTIIGFFFGILLSRIGISIVSSVMGDTYNYQLNAFSFIKEEGFLFVVIVLMGILAALLAAVRIFKMDISKVLAE